MDFFDFNSVSGMIPHGFCIKWTQGILLTYVISDTLIALAYYSIPATLAYIVLQRKDLKFRWLYLMFSAFILACGTTHLMSIVLIWRPLYWLDAGLKALTASFSIATAILLVRLIPRALKLPSIQQLETEIGARHQAQCELQESESKLKVLSQQLTSLIEAIPDAIIFKDGDGRILIANQRAKQLLKLNELDWQGKTYLQLADALPELREQQSKFLSDEDAVWNSGRLHIVEDRILNGGRLIELEVRKAPIFTQDRLRKGMVVIGRDISDIKRAEIELRIAETAIESQEGLIITDENNTILRVNRAFTRLTGYQPEEAIGRKPSILKSGRHDKAFYNAMWRTLERDKFWQGEIWDRRKNGDIYPKWLTINVVSAPDGQTTNYVAAFTDLSQHKEAQEAIHRLAYYDPLTNLPNRRLFQDRLHKSLDNCIVHHQYGAILIIDVDHFKNINDSLGHHIGDQLLVKIASRLKTCVRQRDIVARLGGDEFIILLENIGGEESRAITKVREIGQKILNSIYTPILLGGKEYQNSISIGICLFDENHKSFDDTLKRADAALYQAKDAGRNTLRFFDPQMQALVESRMLLEFDLRHALEQNQFTLHYQAQVDKQGYIYGAEVLLRWEHPQRGNISPAVFIPIAEESELILPIGKWVLQTVCQQLKTWEGNPLAQHLHLAANVSAKQFRQYDFVEHVVEILNNTGADSTKLKLELTESLVMHNVADTIEKMQKLKLHGVRFSMDDFGTGYSSLSQLKKLPLNQLKIDQSFVRDIMVDPNDAVIAQTIIGMGHNLGLNVIAEGVETDEQRKCLARIGCDAFQGYLFNKPAPLYEFEQLITQFNTKIGHQHAGADA